MPDDGSHLASFGTMKSFRKPRESARKPLYPTSSSLDAIECKAQETTVVPKSLDRNRQQPRPRPRTEKTALEMPDVGCEVDDAFIREQRMLLERIQNRRQTTEDTSTWGSDASSSSVASSAPARVDDDPERGSWLPVNDSGSQGHDGELRVDSLALCDWQVIQEHQKRVLDRIQKQSNVPEEESRSSDQAASGIDSELEFYQFQQQQELDRITREWGRHRSALTVDETPSNTTTIGEEGTSASIDGASPNVLHRQPSPSTDAPDGTGKLNFKDTTRDVTTTLSNGTKLKLKGTKHTLDAISDGTAILVSCAECQMLLQVPSSCTAVYCFQCNAVTPLELARSISDSFNDSDIAIALQQQELDLALGREQSLSEGSVEETLTRP